MKNCARMLVAACLTVLTPAAGYADKWCHICPIGGTGPTYDWYSELWDDACRSATPGIDPNVQCDTGGTEDCFADPCYCHSVSRGQGFCEMQPQCRTIYTRDRHGRCCAHSIWYSVPVWQPMLTTATTDAGVNEPMSVTAVEPDYVQYGELPAGLTGHTFVDGQRYTFEFDSGTCTGVKMLGQLLVHKSPTGKLRTLYFAKQLKDRASGSFTPLGKAKTLYPLGKLGANSGKASYAYLVELDMRKVGEGPSQKVLCLLPTQQ